MSRLPRAGMLDITGLLASERQAFLEVLRCLDGAAWQLPTECPSWTVKGIALHVLGDDLSLLSRQRDEATNGLITFAAEHPGLGFRQLLDGFNEQWVHAATFLSEALVVELLRLTGEWTARYYSDVDPDARGEPVGFFGARGPSPYWQISAREYMERWIHQHQVRRAAGLSDLGEPFLHAAAGVGARSLAANLSELGAKPGASLGLSIPGLGSWTLEREEQRWALFDGSSGHQTAELAVDPALATAVLSRALTASEAERAFATSGDEALARSALAEMAKMVGRPAPA